MTESMTLSCEIINGKYRIMNKIGNGSFGEVYLGVNIENGEQVAVKLEALFLKQSQLLLEYKVYNILQGGFGVPRVIYFGKYKHYAVLVMDLLGPSLEDLFNYCGRKFSIKTVIMLAEQMIYRLEYVHSKKFIHRDIKPDNFLMGLNRFCNRVFIVDFGLSKKYIINDRHIELRNDKKLTGTARYVSINVHLGLEQSRRDDMESLGYVLLYFIRGFLPWEGLLTVTRKQKYERIFERKASISVETLCTGLPEEFADYFKYCRSLKFEEEPDYNYLRTKFQNMFYRLNFKYDYMYDWKIINRNKLLSDNASIRENEIIHGKMT